MRFWFGGPRLMGLRTGVSFGPEDFRAPRQATVEGGFVYIVENELGACKVGISRDPLARLAALQTGSPQRLRITHVAATRCSGFEIEQQAHELLSSRALTGEWFDCGPAAARHAVQTSAKMLRRPLAWVDPAQVPQIIALANGSPEPVNKPSNWLYYVVPAAVMLGLLALLRTAAPEDPIEPHVIGLAVAGLILTALMPTIMRLAGR